MGVVLIAINVRIVGRTGVMGNVVFVGSVKDVEYGVSKLQRAMSKPSLCTMSNV